MHHLIALFRLGQSLQHVFGDASSGAAKGFLLRALERDDTFVSETMTLNPQGYYTRNK